MGYRTGQEAETFVLSMSASKRFGIPRAGTQVSAADASGWNFVDNMTLQVVRERKSP